MNSSEARQGKNYKVDRLVLKAMADEAPKARYQYDVALVRGDHRTRKNREIERKFLVKRLPENLKQSRSFVIEQGYLATESAGRQVRLRKAGNSTSLTFKVGRGSHREEREIKLSQKQFAALWPGTTGRRLRKVRYESADRGRYLSGQTCRSGGG